MNSTNSTKDEPLVALALKISQGDQHSFRVLFDQYADCLTGFAQSILRSKDAATEVVDDVLVKIWKNREHLPHIQNLRVYLYTATKNTALNYLSGKARQMITEPFNEIDVELKDQHSPDQQMITKELFKRIHDTVQELPPRCKMIFKLVREDGLRYKEVAEILKISENTVDAQMVIAIKKIKEAIRGNLNISTTPGILKKA